MAPTLKVNPYRLTELRDLAGIRTDAELAKRLLIHPNTLSRIRNGGKLDGDFIARASVVLGAHPGDPLYRIVIPTPAAA